MDELKILGTHIIYPDNEAGLPHDPTFATYCIIQESQDGEYILFIQTRNYWCLACPRLFKTRLSATMAAIRHNQRNTDHPDVSDTKVADEWISSPDSGDTV